MTRILYRRNRKTTFSRVLSAVLAIVFTLSFTGVVHAVAPEGTEVPAPQKAPAETPAQEAVVAPEPEVPPGPAPEATGGAPEQAPAPQPEAAPPAAEPEQPSQGRPDGPTPKDKSGDDEPGGKDETPPEDAGGYTTVSGNPALCDGGLKVDPARSGTFTHTVDDVLVTVTVSITETDDGELLSWTSDFPVDEVIVKGGPNANVYAYSGALSGSMLHAPLNPSNKWADVSWVGFCFGDGGTGPGDDVGVIRVHKFCDADGDGEQSGIEAPLGGFTFDLLRGAEVIDQATTDDKGHAEFDPVAFGTYVVREHVRDGWEVTTPGGDSQTVELDQGVMTVVFGNRPEEVESPEWTKTFRLTVDGTIANDVEHFGAEYVVNGQLNHLTLASEGGGVYSASVDVADGTVIEEWVFFAMVDGVRVPLSAVHGPETIDEDTTNAHTFTPGMIGGTKFIDADMDGAGPFDPDDTFGAGFTFILDGPGLGDGIATLSTENGGYAFTGLLPGTYTLSEVTAPGYTQIHPIGPTGVTLTPNAMEGMVNVVNQAAAPEPMVEKRFQLVTAATLVPAPDSIEVDYVIGGQTTTVTLADQGGGVWLSGPQMLDWGTTISAWSVHAVIDGTRWETPLFVSTTPETLEPDSEAPIVNAATFVPGTVVGAKALDLDGDGTPDPAPDDTLGGWAFTLNGTWASELSGSDGSFSFGGLLPGTYTVAEAMTPEQDALYDLVSPVGGSQSVTVGGGQTTVLDPFVNQPADPAVSLEKFASPGTGVPGDTITYTFTVTNTGPWALDVVISDPMIPALENQSIPTLAPAGQPGDSFTFSVDFTIPIGTAPGPLTNVATATGTDQFDREVTDTATAEVVVGSQVVPTGPVTVSKTANVSQVAPGGTVVYTVTYRNTGDAPIETDFTVVDDFPENLVTVVDAGGGTVADGTITWNITDTLGVGESRTLRYTVRVDSDVTDGTVIDNVVTIAAFDARDTERVTVAAVDVVSVVGEAFLPFTGGNPLSLLLTAILATGVGLAARRRGRAAR